jgi:chemotaxis protein MotB
MAGGGGDAHEEAEHSEHVNHEAWVIPYADMLTLLMGLFLVLYGMSSLDLRKFEAMAQGLNEALGSGERIISPLDTAPGGAAPRILDDAPPAIDLDVGADVIPQVGPSRQERAEAALEREEREHLARLQEEESFDDVRATITRRAEELGLAEALDFRREPRGLVVTILSDRVLFAPGSAQVRPEGAEILRLVAEAVRGVPNPLSVEGHTDDRPITTASFPSNWELSTARATTVLQELVASGAVASEHVSAAGYADQRPLADNATADGRARNRRVELVVLSQLPPEPEAP